MKPGIPRNVTNNDINSNNDDNDDSDDNDDNDDAVPNDAKLIKNS